ncbi:MAG: beta-propeller fold lactonase family protein [Terriglobales bacterium]
MSRSSRFVLFVILALGAALPALSHAQANPGAVFVMTNAPVRNEIVAYARNADGGLKESQIYPTGGRGSGGVTDPLASQGSLTLSQDHSLLFAVNAGSGDISVFQVQGASLTLVEKVPSGGAAPVAVAQWGTLVYVLNEGAASNVTGYSIGANGKLKPIAGSVRFLSTGNSGAASLAFSPDGQFLVVSEKLTNSLDVFHVQIDGTLGPRVTNASAGPGLFSLLFAPNGTVVTTETGPAGASNAGATSAYAVLPNGTLSVISTSVPTLGAATCWNAVTPNGNFVYTSNAATSTISGFAIGGNGALTAVGSTVVGTNPAGSTNLDVAISADSGFLYTLNSGTGTVSIFGINANGTLNNLGDVDGLSAAAGFNGIAAY